MTTPTKAENPIGSITASCGHRTTLDALVDVEYEDEVCNAVHGFEPVTVYAVFCPACADALLAQRSTTNGN